MRDDKSLDQVRNRHILLMWKMNLPERVVAATLAAKDSWSSSFLLSKPMTSLSFYVVLERPWTGNISLMEGRKRKLVLSSFSFGRCADIHCRYQSDTQRFVLPPGFQTREKTGLVELLAWQKVLCINYYLTLYDIHSSVSTEV